MWVTRSIEWLRATAKTGAPTGPQDFLHILGTALTKMFREKWKKGRRSLLHGAGLVKAPQLCSRRRHALGTGSACILEQKPEPHWGKGSKLPPSETDEDSLPREENGKQNILS